MGGLAAFIRIHNGRLLIRDRDAAELIVRANSSSVINSERCGAALASHTEGDAVVVVGEKVDGSEWAQMKVGKDLCPR